MSHNVFVFVPAFGQTLTATTFLTTHALANAFQQKSIGYGVSTLSFPDIAELRSMALTIFYDTMPAMTHLLFLDADMGFSPEVVLDMLLLDEPLVGAIYAQRRLPQSWAGSGTGQPNVPRRGNFMVVEGVGMGCTLIRRDCVANILAKMPQLVDTRIALHPACEMMRAAGANRLIRAFEKLDLPDRGIVSEDLSFCIRHRQCGGEVWASIGHKFSHVGPYDYAGRYLDGIELAQAQQAALAVQPAQPAQPALSAAAPVLTINGPVQVLNGEDHSPSGNGILGPENIADLVGFPDGRPQHQGRPPNGALAAAAE
jgi:hypothetical protein